VYRIFIILSFFFFSLHYSSSVSAQNNDTILLKQHSPKKATILSAVLPGAGQFYNKKYWKIPIIYGGFGTLAYFATANNKLYQDYKLAYKHRNDDDPATIDKFPLYSDQGLLQAKNYYRRNVELSVIFSVVLYTLNVVDAAVDAHLYDFDISDNLAISIKPDIFNNPLTPYKPAQGITLTLHLKN